MPCASFVPVADRIIDADEIRACFLPHSTEFSDASCGPLLENIDVCRTILENPFKRFELFRKEVSAEFQSPGIPQEVTLFEEFPSLFPESRRVFTVLHNSVLNKSAVTVAIRAKGACSGSKNPIRSYIAGTVEYYDKHMNLVLKFFMPVC